MDGRAYKLEPEDRDRCEHCGAGRLWYVVGPDDIATSTLYGNEEEAQDVADELNAAYEKGVQSLAAK